ncbi:ketopantoate hydroxymethyltransferase [Cohnella nanjingensis]|uniref:Ketopantoate hydroxymethyltransferase n=1 Tax=Cohnella nanjingensis TaxID=1387779 RepID=A0A7X0RPZ8_9BACL|nr:ketopantoate hydroxymethyltransferase [Cohnella nanjingensis]MBB6670290.1 ketopantoate hydroxymethyltransferase [Cohnella nanjingensis]
MIATTFLHDVAVYTEGRVSKVVINGALEITDFETKQVTNNNLVLNYIVPVSDVTLITLIELKDSADNLISSNTVNVPITSDTFMLQTLKVKEATF